MGSTVGVAGGKGPAGGGTSGRSGRRQDNARLLTRRNSTSTTGQFNSVREDGVLRVFQSRAEFLHLAILDVHGDVEFFETQPDPLPLPGGRCYTADALVRFRSGRRPVYREVKPLSRLEADPTFDGRLDDMVAACDRVGADFEVVVERYWLDAARWSVTSHLRHSVRRAERFHMDPVVELLGDGALTLVEIARGSRLGFAGRHAALALCAAGRAVIRRDRPVSDLTLVRLA